jgi:hypothetical protein
MNEPMNEPMKEVREGTLTMNTVGTVDSKKEKRLSEEVRETITSSPTPSLAAQRERLNDLSARLAAFRPKLNGRSAPHARREVG